MSASCLRILAPRLPIVDPTYTRNVFGDLIAYTFPLINSALGPCSFLIFAASTATFGLFTYGCVPETKLKSTSELHAEFVQIFGRGAGFIGAL